MEFYYIALFFGILCFPSYLLKSIGFYQLSRNRNLRHPWMAYIPVLRNYLLGELTGDTMWNLPASRWDLVLVPIAIFLLLSLLVGAVIGLPLLVVYIIFYYCVLDKLYKIYKPTNSKLYLFCSILIPFTRGLWIFIIRNNKPDLQELNKDRIESKNEGWRSLTVKSDPLKKYTEKTSK